VQSETEVQAAGVGSCEHATVSTAAGDGSCEHATVGTGGRCW